MKRPILGFLAAAVLSLGLLGTSPARAATSNSLTAATVTPAHDTGEEHRDTYSHSDRQGTTRVQHRHRHRHHHHHHDHDGGHHRHGPCSGHIVVCLG